MIIKARILTTFIFIILNFQQLSANDELNFYASKVCTFNNVSTSEIKYLYLGKYKKLHKQKVIPISTLDEKTETYFIENYLHKHKAHIQAYWIRMIFTGKMQPPIRTDNFETLHQNHCNVIYTRKKLNEKELISYGLKRIILLTNE